MKAIETQVGSDHYKNLGIQPFELTLANFGYEGLRAAVYTKVNKYLIRDKNSHIEDIKKAIHCLEIQLEAAQAEEKPEITCNTTYGPVSGSAVYDRLETTKQHGQKSVIESVKGFSKTLKV